MTEHTKTPLLITTYETSLEACHIKTPNGAVIADVFGTQGEAEATGAFIVKACNSHDELVAALESLLDDVDGYGLSHPELPGRWEPESADSARAALEKAKQ